MTRLGPNKAQLDYRKDDEGYGCGTDDQLTYRLDGPHPQTWIGQGLTAVGITPGTDVVKATDAARIDALGDGVDPTSGERLVEAKTVVDPRGCLAAVPLVDAIGRHAAEAGTTVEAPFAADEKGAARFARLTRAVARRGETQTVGFDDARHLTAVAGVDLKDVYPAEVLKKADEHRDGRRNIRNRGYDLTVDLPKSVSVLYCLAAPDMAADIEADFSAVIDETVTALEGWAGYGLRGHQGDGQTAARIDGNGLLGFVNWHQTARPVDGQAPDPHLHAHVVLFNLVQGVDGKWSAPASGGRDLMRHGHAANAFAAARLRHRLTVRYGVAFGRDPVTGMWEITAIPVEVREVFSKRGRQIRGLLDALGLDYADATTAQKKTAGDVTRQAKRGDLTAADLRQAWHDQVHEAGHTPAGLINTVTRPTPTATTASMPSAEALAAMVFDEVTGLMKDQKAVTRAEVFAAVCDRLPAVADLAEADRYTDAVLATGLAVPLPAAGTGTLTNAARYTTTAILTTEETIIALTRHGYGTTTAVVQPDTAALAVAAHTATTGIDLSAQQTAAVHRLLTAGHAVDAVLGVPGSGKTTMMAAARAAWAADGKVVAGAATAAVAAQNLHAETGIPAASIASWRKRIDDGSGLAGVDVLVVDEAAMADDRDLAHLMTHAADTGTKVVLIGDPRQLKAIGVGGAFQAIHRQVAGLVLAENRRQTDPVERQALREWREGNRGQALDTWAGADRIHAGPDRDTTLSAMLGHWTRLRQDQPYGDVHDELGRLLLLTGTNKDADTLNAVARSIRRAAGELSGPDVSYRLPGGHSLPLAVGDHVRVRRNDYRSRTAGPPEPDVLNGFRGVVTAIDEHRRVRIQWRQDTPDGPVTASAWITPDQIADGALSHGTAMTVAAAQGTTTGHVLVYGLGLDPHTLYAAMSRDRNEAHLYLPLQLLETDTDRERHGTPRSPTEALRRAITAYTTTLNDDRADRLLLAELGQEPDPIAQHQPTEQEIPGWRDRPFGALPDVTLTMRLRDLAGSLDYIIRGAANLTAQAERELTAAHAGHGPAVTALHQRRTDLAEAAQAEHQAARYRAEEAALRADARQAAEQVCRLRAQASRNRVALALTGTTRRALLHQATHHNHTADLAHARADQAADHANRLDHQAATRTPGTGRDRATRELHTLITGWPALLANAKDTDIRTARMTQAAADRETRIAARNTRDLAALRRELATRTGLPADQTAREATERPRTHTDPINAAGPRSPASPGRPRGQGH